MYNLIDCTFLWFPIFCDRRCWFLFWQHQIFAIMHIIEFTIMLFMFFFLRFVSVNPIEIFHF